MRYIDGFVLPVPEKNLKLYKSIAQKAGKIWKEHGALEYIEAVGDDLENKWALSFPNIPGSLCLVRLSGRIRSLLNTCSLRR